MGHIGKNRHRAVKAHNLDDWPHPARDTADAEERAIIGGIAQVFEDDRDAAGVDELDRGQIEQKCRAAALRFALQDLPENRCEMQIHVAFQADGIDTGVGFFVESHGG